MNLEAHFEPSFEAIKFEEIVALIEGDAADIEVRRHSDERWLATIWVENIQGLFGREPRSPLVGPRLLRLYC